jgi:hypothetical protein
MRFDFKRIDEWHKAGQNVSNEAPGSLLNVVDTMTEPLQVSHLLGYLLHTAIDHLHALKSQLVEAKSQHTFAPFTLIRGAIEASSTALWILQDDVPLNVVRRSLTLEHMNLADQRRATRTIDPKADYDEDRLEMLRGVLNRNGMKLHEVKDPIQITKLIQDSAKCFALPNSYLTWQMCSAAAHGRPWARQHLTLFEVHDDDGFSKTLGGQLSSNELAMAISLHTACEVFDKALVVRRTHSTNAEYRGDSFTRPTQGIHVVRRRLIVPPN